MVATATVTPGGLEMATTSSPDPLNTVGTARAASAAALEAAADAAAAAERDAAADEALARLLEMMADEDASAADSDAEAAEESDA